MVERWYSGTELLLDCAVSPSIAVRKALSPTGAVCINFKQFCQQLLRWHFQAKHC